MENSDEYCLIKDEDSHWFLCPAYKREEALRYFAKLYEHFSEGEMDIDPPPTPLYLTEIDGPHRLVFQNPRVNGEQKGVL